MRDKIYNEGPHLSTPVCTQYGTQFQPFCSNLVIDAVSLKF